MIPTQSAPSPSVAEIIEEVQQDPFFLDRFELESLTERPRVIVTNERFASDVGGVSFQHVAPWSCHLLRKVCRPIPLAGKLLEWCLSLNVAIRLLLATRRPRTAALVSLGDQSGGMFCLLNSFKWLSGGPILAYRALLPAHPSRLKGYLIRRALRGATKIAVWSRAQIDNYHRAFDCPRDRLVFLPYKANHSKTDSKPLPVGDYVFSGGNSERDYKTLFEAVQGLSIPVIVSATNPAATKGLTVPENVILISAVEPAFMRLMAGARIMALPLKADIIRGSGEATILNAMWHGRPVIVADNISAHDYIDDGVDGYVVPAGDVELLRRRLVELWDDPAFATRLGEAGHQKVSRCFQHSQFIARIQTLALIVYGHGTRKTPARNTPASF